MCGIVGGWFPELKAGIAALRHRGPDAEGCFTQGSLQLGHTRLAILDLEPRSNQPFQRGPLTLVFNGEIWNYESLRAELQARGESFATTGDTEVLAAALLLWGPSALARLQGMFAVAWTLDGETLYLARDRFGEVPLHFAKQNPFGFASELKALRAMGAHSRSCEMLLPGHYAVVTARSFCERVYYDAPTAPALITREQAAPRLAELILEGVAERRASDVPVCTLLSGGIDSAFIAFGLKQWFPQLTAYTAVFEPKARDLRDARATAEFLGIELIEVPIPMPTAADLAGIVRRIEMPNKAQVEIGWPCLKLAERIQADGFKVTFSGEGSDELWASYGFADLAFQAKGWHQYRKELFLAQARKNFARCNKIFMAHGIECRLPFLSTPLVEFALSLKERVVRDGPNRRKAVLQDALATIMPPAFARRPKIAFQDGLGLKAAIAELLPKPKRYYESEFATAYK